MFNARAYDVNFRNRAKSWAVSQSGQLMVDASPLIYILSSDNEEEFLKKKTEIEYALDRTLLDFKYQFEQGNLEKHQHTLADLCQVLKVMVEEGISFGELGANVSQKS